MFDLKDGPIRAYAAFLGEFFPDEEIPAPTWEDAPGWLRDAIAVAYLQGMFDYERTIPGSYVRMFPEDADAHMAEQIAGIRRQQKATGT